MTGCNGRAVGLPCHRALLGRSDAVITNSISWGAFCPDDPEDPEDPDDDGPCSAAARVPYCCMRWRASFDWLHQ